MPPASRARPSTWRRDWERELAADALGRSFSTRVLQWFGLRRRRVGDLEHADALRGLGVSVRDLLRTLEAVLERFSGNHTPDLTIADRGTLRADRLPPDPRRRGAGIQLVLWTRGPASARALYAELAPRVADDPLFLIYQGELELWMGEYGEAERIFRNIVRRAPTTKWAWIGLGASAMFQGRLREAQTIWARGSSARASRGPRSPSIAASASGARETRCGRGAISRSRSARNRTA